MSLCAHNEFFFYFYFLSRPLLDQGDRNSCRSTKAKHLDWFLVVLRLNCSHVRLMLPSELPGDRLLWARPASSNYSASCSKGKAVDWKEIWHGDVAATDKDVCWTIKKKERKKGKVATKISAGNKLCVSKETVCYVTQFKKLNFQNVTLVSILSLRHYKFSSALYLPAPRCSNQESLRRSEKSNGISMNIWRRKRKNQNKPESQKQQRKKKERKETTLMWEYHRWRSKGNKFSPALTSDAQSRSMQMIKCHDKC